MTANTQAITVANSTIEVPPALISGGGIFSAAATCVVAFLALRKRWSRDNLELTKDRAETNLIASYEKIIAENTKTIQRLDENAREAWRTRAEDAKQIGELSAKVGHLTSLNESLNQQIARLTAMVRHTLSDSDRRLFDQSVNHQPIQPPVVVPPALPAT